jgi:transposase-like protein
MEQKPALLEGSERRDGERSEAARSGEVSNNGRRAPDPQVPAKATRRRFSSEFKLRVLREADACKEPGEIGALLRRHGLYSSHLTTWRKERERGAEERLSRKRGRKPAQRNPLDKRVAQLERENRRLQEKLRKAEIIIDVQKKVSTLLGIPLKNVDSGGDE